MIDYILIKIVEVIFKRFVLLCYFTFKEYVKNNKGTTVNIPIQLVFFKKDALTKLLNTFGQYNNDEHYVPKLQKMRQGEYTQKELADAVGFISGTTRFAGNNRPLFNWNNISESMAKTSKADTAALNKINEMHCVDLSLVNDFFSLLGKTWTPSMYMSEFAREYGQIEALQMLQELTKKDSLKKTKNKP